MKKKLLPIALLAAMLVACGGGGGSGDSSEQASSHQGQSSEQQSSESQQESSEEQSSEEQSSEEQSSEEQSSEEESSEQASEEVQYGVTILNKDAIAAENWYNGATRELDVDILPEDNIDYQVMLGNLYATSSDDEVVSTNGLVLTANKEGTVTITVHYHDAIDTVEVTTAGEEPVVVQTLKEIREGIAAGTIKAKDELEFYTEITATFEPTGGSSGHVYSGIYSQDGEYPMVLYAGKTSQYWDDEELKIGDRVYVKGEFSPYNGLNEVKPSIMTKLSEKEAAKVADPVGLTLDATNYNATTMTNNDGRLVHMEGLVYKSGKIESTNAADKKDATLKFALPADNGDIEVDVVARYHLASGLVDLKTLVGGLEAGDIVTIDAVGLINGQNLSLSLQYLDGKTPAECIVKTGHQELPAPTGLTISGDAEVEIGKTIQLTATPTPEDANPAVVWDSLNKDIATIDEKGIVTGVAKGKATITVKSALDETVTQTKEITVKEPLASVVANPVAGTAYKLGLNQAKLAKDLFFNGVVNDRNYGLTVTDPNNAADVEMVAVEGGYNLKVTVGETVKYINTKLNWNTKDSGATPNPSVSMQLGDTAEQVWKLDADLNTMIATIDGFGTKDNLDFSGGNGDYYIGTYSSYDTLSMSKTSYAATSYVSHFYKLNAQELTEITVTAEGGKKSVEVDQTLQMVATPNAGAELGEVTWAVDNTDFATIDQTGLLTGKAAGTVEVSATSGTVVGKISIEIKDNSGGGGEDTPVTVNFSAENLIEDPTAQYTGGSVKLGNKDKSEAPFVIDDVLTAYTTGSDGNTGKIYKSNDYGFQIRLYNSGNGTFVIAAAEGYEITAATVVGAPKGSNWWVAGAETEMTIAENGLTATYGGGDYVVYSAVITYVAK